MCVCTTKTMFSQHVAHISSFYDFKSNWDGNRLFYLIWWTLKNIIYRCFRIRIKKIIIQMKTEDHIQSVSTNWTDSILVCLRFIIQNQSNWDCYVTRVLLYNVDTVGPQDVNKTHDEYHLIFIEKKFFMLDRANELFLYFLFLFFDRWI